MLCCEGEAKQPMMHVGSCDAGMHLYEYKGVENQRSNLPRLVSPCCVQLLAYLRSISTWFGNVT